MTKMDSHFVCNVHITNKMTVLFVYFLVLFLVEQFFKFVLVYFLVQPFDFKSCNGINIITIK